MKIRDSGMPDEAVWAGFFDPQRDLLALGFTNPLADVADLGCGYGIFSVAAARLTRGTVHAYDIEAAMVEATGVRARAQEVLNVVAEQRDVVSDGTGLPDGSVGYAMLFNVLHAEDPMGLVREARRILGPGGRIAVMHWNHDASTPRGPDLAIRPRPERCRAWLEAAGFPLVIPFVSLPPFHFGVVGESRP